MGAMNAVMMSAFADELSTIYGMEKDAGPLGDAAKKVVSKVDDIDRGAAIKIDQALQKVTKGKLDAPKLRKLVVGALPFSVYNGV